MKILVVDDSKVILKTLLIMLKKAGYNDLESAMSVNEALFKIKNEKIDLIISDWKMPDQTGIDLLKILRQSTSLKNIPFIMATALSEKDKIMEALKLGVQGYLTKPVSYNILVNKLYDIAIQYDLDKPTCEIPKLENAELKEKAFKQRIENVNHHTETNLSTYSEYREGVVYEKQVWNSNGTFQYFFGSNIGGSFKEVISSYYGDKEYYLLTSDVFFDECNFYKELKKIVNDNEINIVPNSLTIEKIGEIINEFENMGLSKNSVLIGLGGTEILGASGFIGKNYLGGISTIWIPSTFSAILNISLFPSYFINSKTSTNIFSGPFLPTSVFVDLEMLLLLKKEKYDGGISELIRSMFYLGDDYFHLVSKKNEFAVQGDWEALKEIFITALLKKITGINHKKGKEIKNFALPFIQSLNTYFYKRKNIEISTITKYALEIIVIISNKMNLLNDENYKKCQELLNQISDKSDLPDYDPEKLLKCFFVSNYQHEQIFLPREIGKLHPFNDIEIRTQILEGFKDYNKKA